MDVAAINPEQDKQMENTMTPKSNATQCNGCLEWMNRTYSIKNRKCRQSKTREQLIYLLTGRDQDVVTSKSINQLIFCLKCITHIEAAEHIIRTIKKHIHDSTDRNAVTHTDQNTVVNSSLHEEKDLSQMTVMPVHDNPIYSYNSSYPTPVHSQTITTVHSGQIPGIQYSFMDMMSPMNIPTSDIMVTQQTQTHQAQPQRHQSQKRRNAPGKLVECKTCGEKFSSSDAKYKHKIKVHIGRRFACDHCSKRFWNKQDLKVHVRRHTGERPYNCDLCDRWFVCATHLKTHRRSHFGEKPYTCEVCHRSFTESQTLHRHKRLHTGEKPYSCDLCEMRFTHSATLWSHKRKHSGTDKPHICSVCNKGFSWRHEVIRHMRIHEPVGGGIQLGDSDVSKEDSAHNLQTLKELSPVRLPETCPDPDPDSPT